jgi:hypothetical protein
MAEEHEVLLGRARGQVGARRVLHLDGHAADVPLLVVLRRRVREPDEALVGCRIREEAHPQVGGQPVGHRELALDERRGAGLVEAPHRAGRTGPGQARFLEERDEVADDGLLVGRNHFFSKPHARHHGLPAWAAAAG